jgi:shikimate dehydrogenase
MTVQISGRALVAGVVGFPVDHSLSPLIHNAWIEAAGLDAVYAPFAPLRHRFASLVDGLRGGAVRGLNVTVPFKEEALALASLATDRARRAGAANLLLFDADGAIRADNTDGVGLLAALRRQAPGFDPRAGPAVVLGAGGAARGAVAALADAGAPEVRIVNRTHARAVELAAAIGAPARASLPGEAAFAEASLIVNATSLGLGGGEGPAADFSAAASGCVVLDMVYRPLRTPFLGRATAAGLATAHGLEMLIAQAEPSFEAFFGQAPPRIDVRGLCLAELGEGR